MWGWFTGCAFLAAVCLIQAVENLDLRKEISDLENRLDLLGKRWKSKED